MRNERARRPGVGDEALAGTTVTTSPIAHVSLRLAHPPLLAGLRKSSAEPVSRAALPSQPSRLIGRTAEVDSLTARLLCPDIRLLTLIGPAGTGKTRLALSVAEKLADAFEDGVCFVELGPITDSRLVMSTTAQALGLGQADEEMVLERLRRYLLPKQLLLVLDNFEQVAAAAPQLADLLATCPTLKVLVTSRHTLRLRWEHIYPVPPLEVPDVQRLPEVEALNNCASVALFVDRARAARPDFTLNDTNARTVAEICAALDGLPLAIELAAAHSGVLRPEGILEGLRERRLDLLAGAVQDLPTRQQTLRAAIGWSYELLGPAEQVLFRRLAVFVGGCTLAAAEATCRMPDEPYTGVSDCLPSLVSKSLVRLDDAGGPEPRFRMLQTIRTYALEELVRSGEAGYMRQRHAEFFCALAEEVEPKLLGPEQAAWLDRLEREHDNLRAALRWCLDAGDPERALRLGGAMWRLWYVRGYFTEGRAWLAEVLALPGASAPTSERARVLNGAGNLAYNQGDYAPAQALHEESLAIRRVLDDRRGIASSLNNLGLIARYRGDYATAYGLLQEAIAIERELNLRGWEAVTLNNLGNVQHELGDLAEARVLQSESLAIASAANDAGTLTMALCDLGTLAWEEGDYATARKLQEDALARRRELGDQRGIVLSLVALGHVAVCQRDRRAAITAFVEGLTISRDVGDRYGVIHSLEGLAALAANQGQPERALRLAGAAAGLRAAIGVPLSPVSARVRAQLELARKGINEVRATGAFAQGRLMPIDQAISVALAGAQADQARLRGGEARPRNGHVGGLTPRELEVAALIARGLTNREIASELVISEGTAANHVERTLNKLGFHSRAQVATWAIEQRLISAVAWPRVSEEGQGNRSAEV